MDGYTQSEVPHRALSEQEGKRKIAVAGIQEMLVRHHVSPEMQERTRRQRDSRLANGYFRITRFTGLSQRNGKQEGNNDDQFTDLLFQTTVPNQSHHYPAFTLAASVR